jgi:hypothetical protein
VWLAGAAVAGGMLAALHLWLLLALSDWLLVSCCWQELLSLEVGELRSELEGLEGELGASRHSGASLSSKVGCLPPCPVPTFPRNNSQCLCCVRAFVPTPSPLSSFLYASHTQHTQFVHCWRFELVSADLLVVCCCLGYCCCSIRGRRR